MSCLPDVSIVFCNVQAVDYNFFATIAAYFARFTPDFKLAAADVAGSTAKN